MIKTVLLYLMALLYVAAGVNHFVNPDFYMKIMPPYLPWHLELVYLSGAIEIALGVLLIPTATRKLAAWGVVALLIAVFPANLYHYTSGGAGMEISTTALIVRMILQLPLILWAWWYTRD